MVDLDEYIPGVRIGHAQDEDALTGCTVILCESGAVGGIDQRGGAPGTRETDLLAPDKLVQQVDALVLSGGSAFGLDAAGGAMNALARAGRGLRFEIIIPLSPKAGAVSRGAYGPPGAWAGFRGRTSRSTSHASRSTSSGSTGNR